MIVYRTYLGIWQLKELKDDMSNALFAGSKVEGIQLLLAEMVPSFSVTALLKETFPGDANRLSGRLCSKLQLVTIYEHIYFTIPDQVSNRKDHTNELKCGWPNGGSAIQQVA